MKWMAHDITQTSPLFLSFTTVLMYLDLASIWLVWNIPLQLRHASYWLADVLTTYQLIDSAKEHDSSRKIVLNFALVLHYLNS